MTDTTVRKDVSDIDSDRASECFAVTRLTLTDFRCYEHLRLDINPGPVILTGPNGAGKTNLLEAISFLVPGRGLRSARLSDIARINSYGTNTAPANEAPRNWGVAASVLTPSGPVQIGTGRKPGETINAPEKRTVRVDGETLRSQATLSDYMAAHWLTPQMDRLFVEGASGRRRFLDRMVFGWDPAHAGRVNAYDHALRERARLLQEGQNDSAWLTALEETIASKGVAVAAARREHVLRLAPICHEDNGPFPGALIELEGELESWFDEGPALEAEDRFRHALATSRHHTADKGRPPLGPHRSDLGVVHRPKSQAASLCSTGEQKALLISLVLANAMLVSEERGRVPVLLLDEVAAHLDSHRREALFEKLLDLGTQVWMTGTDASMFEPLRGLSQQGKAGFFEVADATVTEH